MYKNLKIGLALGSGASRGLAHIGVIEILEKYGVIADAVSGSSIGSVVGALYCSGFDFKYVSALCKNLNKKPILILQYQDWDLLKVIEYVKSLNC
ncbi:patatin-like phospholipase family protein [Caloramator sp. mosi_1]|uniref:patatin-like phospholipase family protein n=1 Tax=Caloramator sp. mosi_1 TaxID=3023090 RepID=UPI002362AE27|nr:patatin-like phospholipase family protein [Caloramator sp. mosi_1]WDC84037.1 patatin-like phospholipase family protein [Caloramator sp. mosi_1]